MKKIKLGVIYGGLSTEHEVSINSAKSVIDNLDKDKYDIYKIYIDKKGEWYKEDNKIDNVFDYLRSLDVVFPVLHGLYGEDGTIQGLFELLGVPYVGCGVLSSSLGMDKVYAKMIFEKAHINQAKAVVINAKNGYTYVDEELNNISTNLEGICDIVNKKLKYPVFVKPSNSGSSVGVSKAENDEELKNSIQEAVKYDTEILIEQGINGKEIECAVLGIDNVEASCVGQILSADEFYDYDSKYKNAESKTIIPADVPKEISEKIRETAIKAFKAVKGSGLARVDFFVDKETNEIYLNEINTMPGFTNISMYPQLWESCGLTYSELLDRLIEQEL